MVSTARENGESAAPHTAHGRFTEEDYRDQADFRAAIRRFLRFSEEQARLAGITPQQHSLLLVVRGHRAYPGVSIGEVAEGLQVRHHAASLLVDRGVRRGLLTRVEDPRDRRRALVSLTEEGQRVLDDITVANRGELGALDTLLFRTSFLEALKHMRRGAAGPAEAGGAPSPQSRASASE